jgi:DNA-binding beta-propeller fold protein YncE
MRSRTIVGRAAITLLIATLGIGTTVLAVRHRVVGVQDDGSIVVPNGQTLTPAGTHIEVNDRPLFGARALHLIDVQSQTLKQTIAISNSFVGVAFSPDGNTIYVGSGASNDVKIFKAANCVRGACRHRSALRAPA